MGLGNKAAIHRPAPIAPLAFVTTFVTAGDPRWVDRLGGWCVTNM